MRRLISFSLVHPKLEQHQRRSLSLLHGAQRRHPSLHSLGHLPLPSEENAAASLLHLFSLGLAGDNSPLSLSSQNRSLLSPSFLRSWSAPPLVGSAAPPPATSLSLTCSQILKIPNTSPPFSSLSLPSSLFLLTRHCHRHRHRRSSSSLRLCRVGWPARPSPLSFLSLKTAPALSLINLQNQKFKTQVALPSFPLDGEQRRRLAGSRFRPSVHATVQSAPPPSAAENSRRLLLHASVGVARFDTSASSRRRKSSPPVTAVVLLSLTALPVAVSRCRSRGSKPPSSAPAAR